MDIENELEVVHKELLSMMKDIHKICVDNNIYYSLTGGSLLGAIRNSGYIPWDDDIDIMMDRKNYKKLCKVMRSDSKYLIGRGPWLQHIRPIKFNSAIEPYIDVFILDDLPDKKWKAFLKIFTLRLLQGMLKEEITYTGFSPLLKICIFMSHMLGKLFTRKFKLYLYDTISQIGDPSKSRYVSITNDSFGLLTKKHDQKMIGSYELHRFEDTKLMITRYYDEYLTTRYGPDYMIPPKENEIVRAQHAKRIKVKNERVGI